MLKQKKSKLSYQIFKYLIALFIILIPWQTRWIVLDWPLASEVWEYGRLSLYFSALILFVSGVFFAFSHQKELRFSRSKFFYFLFIYAVVVSFFSPVPAVSFYYLFLLYSAALFAYFLKFIPKLFTYRALLISGLIQGILALWQFMSQAVFANKWLGLAEHFPYQLGTAVVESGGERILRAYGALPHPNVLGGFLFLVIFLGLYVWLEVYRQNEKNGWLKSFKKKTFFDLIFVILALVVSTYGLLASFSRSALAALVLSLFSLLLISALRRHWLAVSIIAKYFVILLIVFWSFSAIFPGAWQTRLSAQGRLEEKSVSERVDTLSQLGWSSYQKGFFGQGLGMNTLETYRLNSNGSIYDVQPVHNIFILMLAETGVVGVFLLFNVIRKIIKSANQVDVMSTSLILGLVVIGMLDHYLWTSWTGLLLVALGLVNLYKYQK